MRDIGIVFSDGHLGSIVGLMPRGGVELDKGNLVKPNLAQEWLLTQFEDFLAKAAAIIRPDDTVHVIGNGDLLDNIWLSNDIWSRSDVDIIRGAVDFYGPLRRYVQNGGGFFMTRGTRAHVGKSGALEELVARELNTTKWPESSARHTVGFLRMNLQGVELNFAHHGRAGRLKHTKSNPGGTLATAAVINAHENGTPVPDVIYRSHTHNYYDTHDNFSVRVINLPAWQLATEYGEVIAPGDDLAIGGNIFVVEDGKFDCETYRYWTKEIQLPAWTPQRPPPPTNSKASSPSSRGSRSRKTAQAPASQPPN